MSQLIQMRSRINAIETIEKNTHAMQLISMSTHVRLRDKRARIEEYHQALSTIFHAALSHTPQWHNDRFMPQIPVDENPLIILIGSQKGLCGTFNNHLFERFEKDINRGLFKHASIISVGKKATEYIRRKIATLPIPLQLVGHYDELNSALIPLATSFVHKDILTPSIPYSQVMVYNNYSATFFTPRQEVTQLIPYITQVEATANNDFVWEDEAQTVLDACADHLLRASLYTLLTKSLLAEQAARFVSMDNATRNAQNLRDTMNLQYNKLRQAKITQELTELSGSFQKDLSP